MKSIHDLIKQHLKKAEIATAQEIADAIRQPVSEVLIRDSAAVH
ncbi:hypothetical protein [Tepidimonas taiwanensis]|nr:hypothetical protein [Tepidimonas taiwanensis]